MVARRDRRRHPQWGQGDDVLVGGPGFWDRLNGDGGSDYLQDEDGVFAAYGGPGDDLLDLAFDPAWTKHSGSSIRRSDGRIQGGGGSNMLRIVAQPGGASPLFFSIKAHGVNKALGDADALVVMKGDYVNGSVVDYTGIGTPPEGWIPAWYRLYASHGGINVGGAAVETIGSESEADALFGNAVEQRLGTVYLSSDVVSELTPGEVVAGETATATFRGFLYGMDLQGQRVAAASVTSQTYALDAGPDATILQVSDSRGLAWDISGSTATLAVGGPNPQTSFEVTVTARFGQPGTPEVTFSAQTQYGDSRLAETAPISSSSKKGDRVMKPHANPGPVITPTEIYHLLDDKGAGGHSAVIIPNGNGCTYYSYGASGKVTQVAYNNIDDALACAKDGKYTRVQWWACDAAAATRARAVANAWHNTTYKVDSHNCWGMVYEALKAAVGNDKVQKASNIPKVAYEWNLDYAKGSKSL